jgi:hypothetical protein
VFAQLVLSLFYTLRKELYVIVSYVYIYLYIVSAIVMFVEQSIGDVGDRNCGKLQQCASCDKQLV